ncbi:GDP-mannose 4,6-dehydratase, partial [Lachnoclostridium sp. 210928-DFI.6.3]|nr:GDP-mannose 4,6-dehydratase [Lachnoclostridium sp. 210928-DFI.6.3]
QNVTGMVVLLEAMAAHDVDRFVFSSSAAVYGTPQTGVVTEQTPTRPESPYGESKLIGEWLLADQSKAREQLRHTSLRYFNVV